MQIDVRDDPIIRAASEVIIRRIALKYNIRAKRFPMFTTLMSELNFMVREKCTAPR